MWLYSPACVRPGRKPRRPGFSEWGSFENNKGTDQLQLQFSERHIIWASLWENRSSGFPTRSDTNRAVQSQKMARSLKFVFRKQRNCTSYVAKNKGADQLCGYREADLRLCFRICKNPLFSWQGSYFSQDFQMHLAVNISNVVKINANRFNLTKKNMLRPFDWQTVHLSLLVLSAHNLCKQFGPRSGWTMSQISMCIWSRSKLMVFLKGFFQKVNFEKKSADDKNAWKITQHAMS